MDIRVFIVDDHQLFIDGIKAILNRLKGISIVGSALSGKECILKLKDTDIDILITDISMPEMKGDELIRNLVGVYPDIKVLTLSMHNDYANIDMMLKAGVLGYILKNTGVVELKEAIEVVASGNKYFSPSVSDVIAKGYLKNDNVHSDDIPKSNEVFLTRREKGVLKLIFAGMSSQSAADELCLSYHTVTQHRKNINAKLGTSNIDEIERIVKERDLFK